MKYILIITVLLLLTASLQAQKVCFAYDNAGNRTNRTICFKNSLTEADSNSVSQPITENLGEMIITMYPNPTKGQLTIIVTNMPIDAKGEIILSDLAGRLLIRQNTIQETTLLDLSAQPIGIYVLRIRVGDKVSEWKVIKE